MSSVTHEPLSVRAADKAQRQLNFSDRNILLEVLQMLELAEQFIDKALGSGAASSPQETQSLLGVSREIRSAMILVKEQLA
jgi:hypothetical protein